MIERSNNFQCLLEIIFKRAGDNKGRAEISFGEGLGGTGQW
jgi:hypothetical protein